MQPAGSGPSQDQRITIVEILGYAGTAIALVGTGAVVGSFTSGSRWVTVIVSLLLAGALFVAGLITGGAAHDRLQRMRSVLWLLSVGAFQSFADALIDPSGQGEVFVMLLLTGAVAAALWFLHRRALQQLAMYVSLLGAVLVLVVPDSSFGLFGFLGAPDLAVTGIVMMVIGWAWFAVGFLGVVVPPRTAMVLGSITVLLAGLVLASEIQETAFLIVAVGSALLLAIGNRRSDRAVGGIGVGGLLVGLAVYFGEIVSGDTGSIIALVVGVGVLLAAILLGRNWGAVPTELPSLGNLSPPPPPPPPNEPPPSSSSS
jgi:hypothetical protein